MRMVEDITTSETEIAEVSKIIEAAHGGPDKVESVVYHGAYGYFEPKQWKYLVYMVANNEMFTQLVISAEEKE